MILFPQVSKGIFKNGLAYIFLLVSLFVNAIILDWSKIYNYVSHFGETMCQPIKKETISFGIYDMSNAPIYNPFEFIEGLFYLFSFPATIIKEILITDLKAQYVDWCPEKFDVLEIISFLIINSIYWLFLGYLIETAHDHYTKIKPITEKTLSIFGNREN